jgi:hypothetical protein
MQAEAKKIASDARIAAKQKIIDAGGVVPDPKPVVEEVKTIKKEAKKATTKKATAKKTTAKKRGRPAKSKTKK